MLDPTTSVILLVGGALVAGVGFYFGLQVYAHSVVRPLLRVEPDPAHRGGTIQLTLQLNPTRALVCEYVEARLKCIRRFDQGAPEMGGWDLRKASRKAADTEVDNVVDSTNYLAAAELALPARPTVLSGEMLVPFDGFPTRTEGKLQIRWELTVQIKLKGFPSPSITRELKVVR